MTTLRAAVSALRPAHWLKNAPVLAGAVFGGRLGDGNSVRTTGLAFVAFCLVASAGYLVNDVVDRDVDRGHPTRGSRAIASGALSARAAIGVAIGLAVVAGTLATLLPLAAAAGLAAYGALTLAYTFVLRRWLVIAVLAVAAGFVLRAAVGAAAAGVEPSPWLLSLVGVLALGLAVSKKESEERRRRIEVPSALRRATDGLLAATALGYLAYGFSPDTVALHGTRWLPVTAIPVIAALARSRARLRGSIDGAGPAELVARDPVLVGLGILWAALVVVVLRAGAR